MTIRNRHLLAAGVVLLATLVLGVLLAHRHVAELELARAAGELDAAAEVTAEMVRERTDGLAVSAEMIAETRPLPTAIASGERLRVLEALASVAPHHRDLSFLLVAPPAGEPISWSIGLEPGQELAQLGREAAAGAATQGVMVVDGRLTVFASRPVREASTGETVAGLVAGARVRVETLGRLARLTATEVVVLADGEPVASTLRPGRRIDPSVFGSSLGGAEVVEIDGAPYLARLDRPHAPDAAVVPGAPLSGLLLLRSLESRRTVAGALTRNLVLTALLGTVLAFALVWRGSRRLDRALGDLTDAMTETAATGRLGQESLERLDRRWAGTEVDDLRAAFRELMQTVEESVRGRERSYVEAIGAVVAAIDARDHETTGHSFRVAHYALALARELDVDRRQLRAIEWGALLHDVGKIAIPDAILRKTGQLTEDEWHVMRQHPSWGYEMLADVKFLEPALEIVYSHHERWDGEGYPRGLAGEEIPLAARIFSVVDTYDSITSDRPYRRARSHGDAIVELCRVAGTQLDPDIVEAFIRVPEVDLRRLRERSERLDLTVRIPDALSDLPMAEDGTWG